MTASSQVALPTYISFSAEINPSTTEVLLATMAQCVNNGVKDVHLLLSTPGGAVMNGLTIYNVLRGMPFTLTTHNVGNVDSIGNAIFLAGAKRLACPHSTFMFHGVGLDVPPGMRLEEKFLREILSNINADQTRIGSILTERTQLTSEQISVLFLEATTKDANYAAGVGIVDEVIDVDIPSGAPILSLVFPR